jgi:uncharacterized membrane protein YdbT with pleckstrin-like domain
MQEILLPEEKIIYYTRPHYIVFLTPMIFLIVAFTLYAMGGLLTLLAIMALMISIAFWLLAWSNYAATEFIVTNQRLIMKSGMLNKNLKTLPFTAIDSLDLKQSFWGRIFKFGSICIIHASGRYEQFNTLEKPNEFVNCLIKAINK